MAILTFKVTLAIIRKEVCGMTKLIRVRSTRMAEPKKTTIRLRKRDRLEQLAKKHNMSMTELVNSYINLGILIDEEMTGNRKLVGRRTA